MLNFLGKRIRDKCAVGSVIIQYISTLEICIQYMSHASDFKQKDLQS